MEKNGEPLCLAFNKLPSKKEYPDYYTEIKRPIALDMMKSKITRGIYKSVDDFVADIDLMCANARTYNIPDSYIYEIAGDIKSYVHELAAEEAAKITADVASPTPHLKLRVREAQPPKDGSTPTADHAQDAATERPHLTLKLKRKRAKDDSANESGDDSDSSDASESDQGMRSVVKKKTAAAPKKTKGAAVSSTTAAQDAALDALFQAIYDAELGAALKLLETPGLPLNGMRRMVLKETVEGVSEDDEFQWAPLHAAAYYGRLKVAQVLSPAAAPANEPASTPEPKKTPARRAKTRGSESTPGSQAIISPALALITPSLQGGFQDSDPAALAAITAASAQQMAQQQASLAQLTMPVSGQLPSAAQGTATQPSSGMPPIPQCIGGIGHQEITHPQMADAMQEIIDCVSSYRDSEGEHLAEAFEELPDKTEYPEYYDVIVHPMALSIVKSKIAAGYRSFDAFDYDMLWIFNNATFFNESDSQIYQDAVALEAEYRKARREALAKYSIPFDTSYSDAVPAEGRYVHRLTAGELDLYVGDFIYVKNSSGGMRVAMITHLRVGGPMDRRKFVDGIWFLTPSEIPELAGQPVYPHQLFAGPAFDSHGVRGICGKCYILSPNVYMRVYPQGFAAQDLYVCESSYIPGSGDGQPGSFKPVSNWANDFKTPIMRSPAFIQYIAPLTLTKQPQAMWNSIGLLPHLGLTILNYDAAARAQAQGQIRSPTQAQQQQQQHQQQQSQMSNLPPMRPPSAQAPAPPQAPQGFTQVYQALALHHQQKLASAQSQHTQRENNIRQQFMAKMAGFQQQNPSFIGSLQHQTLMQQQSQVIQQSQNLYFSQIQQLQQAYNQQTQALKITYQQQSQALSPLANAQLSGQQMQPSPGLVPMSSGNMQTATSSPAPRPNQISMPMSAPLSTPMPAANPGLPVVPQNGVSRPGSVSIPPGTLQQPGNLNVSQFYSQAQQLQQELLRSNDAGPATPSKMPGGTLARQPSISQQIPAGSNAQAMMAMLLQQQQQLQAVTNGQQPGTPKQTSTPLSPELAVQSSNAALGLGPNLTASQSQAQDANQQHAVELWKKASRVFVSHGNARITKSLGIQIATPDLSLFMHLPLNALESNHAVKVPQSANSILLRPVPGPFNSNGKIVLTLAVNGRRCLPRLIPDNTANLAGSNSGMVEDTPSHMSDDTDKEASTEAGALAKSAGYAGMVEDTPSHMSDDTDKEASTEAGALAKSAGYAYEVPLLTGLNIVDLEVSAAEWKADAPTSEHSDQQVPPAAPAADSPSAKTAMKHYLIFLTRS
ncbi:hypothetical protein GGI12_003476 [Dipsacomyces acuminosporus]|nr:hypothetical protein GGI12_003476 [Dipsacomyces acuminosporus]